MKLPRNVYGFADLHRPYVDRVKFSCENCGGEMARIPEVADAWFDSGAMPLAQAHFPFDQFTGSLKKVPIRGKELTFRLNIFRRQWIKLEAGSILYLPYQRF